jgi:hypothetical protein
MVNPVKIMMKPYMVAGNLAKNAICGVGDLIDNSCGGGNGKKNGSGCGALDNLNPFHRDTTDERDGVESSGPLRNK